MPPSAINAETVSRNGLPIMRPHEDELIATCASLINRLRNWQDQSSWNEFFNTYWRLIYGVARKAGLSDDEAQEVVQETLISVAKHMPTFRYDPAIGSFKTWLLNMTRWRIIAQFRKRQPLPAHPHSAQATTAGTGTTDRIADPNSLSLDAVWEAEWETSLLDAAMTNVRRHGDPQRYQIFDFYVNKDWPPDKVAESFGVSVNQVYQIKHRVTEAIRAEVRRLEKEMT
jgi:RNA polymerase sigma-70 factor (ECF subfamily)